MASDDRLWCIGWLLLVCAVELSVTAADNSGSGSRYRVLDENGTACVVADLTGAAFSLPYPCCGGRRQCTAEVALPAGNCSRVAGRCGNRTAQLEVAWSDGRFRLELAFKQRTFTTVWAQVKTETVTYSYLSDMRLLVDLRDPAFVNASTAKGQSPVVEFSRQEERSLLLFAAPAGSAFVCQSPEEVRLRRRAASSGDNADRSASGDAEAAADAAGAADTADAAAVAIFPAVHLSTSLGAKGGGGGGGDKSHEGEFLCEADSKRHRTGIAALVMAGVIGVCMLVIVVGYLVTRLNKSSRYTNME